MITFYKDKQKVITCKYENGLHYLQGTVSRGEANVSVSMILRLKFGIPGWIT